MIVCDTAVNCSFTMSHDDTVPPLADPASGDLLAERYEVERTLGSGGMGLVLQVRDTHNDSSLALKLLKPGRMDRDAARRMLREATAVAAAHSEHVPRIHDSGTLSAWGPYLVMDLLDGETLRKRLDVYGTLPPQQACDVAMQICAALARPHAEGIVHRDLKPSNVFLVGDGDDIDVRLLDFGIAKFLDGSCDDTSLTVTGAFIGSPRYTSPEQLRDASAVDARSDIWSLGGGAVRDVAG